MAYVIERVALPRRAVKPEPGAISAHGFQRWLATWRERQADGWDVTVLLSGDETHAVGLAYRPEDQ